MAVNARLQLGLRSEMTGTADLSVPRDLLNYVFTQELTSGTSSGQVDISFHDTRTLTSGSSENIDLAGTLTDSFGQTVSFAKVKVLMIRNKSTARTLTVGGAASNGFTSWVGSADDTVKVQPGGVFLLVAPGTGYTVTSNTGDILKIANDAGSTCDYDLIVLGTSS